LAKFEALPIVAAPHMTAKYHVFIEVAGVYESRGKVDAAYEAIHTMFAFVYLTTHFPFGYLQ
jgi:hypothetical protein